MISLIRRYWPVDVLAVTFLIVVFIFGSYLTNRQRISDARAERQRAAICDTLANIPGRIPPEIVRDRRVFARPGHPRECQPTVRAKARSAPAATPSGPPRPQQTVVIILTPGRPASPAASHTASPRPSPTHSPSPRPSPAPTLCPPIICY